MGLLCIWAGTVTIMVGWLDPRTLSILLGSYPRAAAT
jgi:hypothetical protein